MFAALNDSDSEDEAPQAPKQVKAPAAAPVVAPKVEKKPERKPRTQVREDRPERPRAERDNTPYDGADKIANPATDRERQGKGERKGKGERGERGERRNEGKGAKGKGVSRGDSNREFPRRSGTGRERENPRSGGGKFNWGKDDGSEKPPADGVETAAVEGETENATPAAQAAEPVVEEEEEKTMSLDEYEKLQTAKLAALNLNKVAERVVEADADVQVLDDSTKKVEDQYECMFHDPAKQKKDFGRKKGRHGSKQADLVLNMKFVDENADAGKGERQGKGKGERRGKGDSRKGGAPSGKGQHRNEHRSEPSKQNIDLSNDMAFPTLGA